MGKVRIGIIGVNGFAQVHLRSIENCENAGLATLVAAVVRPQSRESENCRAAEARGVRIYPTLEEMLDGEQGNLDLVAVPTGIDSHAEFSIAALRKGYHVMCEKPAAGTMEDVTAMLQAQRESGKTLSIGFQNIFTPTVQRVKEIRLAGTLGKLLEARTKVSWPRTSSYYGRNAWSGKLTLNGKPILDSPLQNATAHYLQNMLYAAGAEKDSAATPVAVYGENYHAQPIESADTQYIRVETEEGPLIQMSATHACNENHDPVTDYLFEKGRIRWIKDSCEVYRYDGEGEILLERVENDDMDVHHRVFWGVCHSLPAGETPLCTIGNSWQQVLCINKLFEAARIIEISPEFYGIEKNGEEVNYYLPGIVELQDRMFAGGQSFAEAGAPWAVPGSRVTV